MEKIKIEKNKFKEFIDKSGVYIRYSIFLIAIVVITFSLPNQRTFRYEYQKGSPWMHENLIAPYSFTIFKLNDEFFKEKDSINQYSKPYFKRDKQIKLNQQNLFKLNFDTVWASSFKEEKKPNIKILEQCLKTFDYIYDKGVVEYVDKNEISSIIIIKNNISEEYSIDEVFTLKSSYTYLVSEFKTIFSKEKNIKDLSLFIKKLHLNEFIQANLLFDKSTSNKIKHSKTNSISLTRGMIQKGEAIVSKGEIINLKAFRILESYRKHFETETAFSSFNLIFIGQFFLVFISILLLFLFLYTYRKDVFESTSQIIFILLLIVLMVFAASIVESFDKASIYIFPFMLLPIILKVFFDSRTAYMSFVVAILIIGFIVPNGFQFSFLQLTTGFIAIISLASISRRGRFFTTAFFVFLSYSFI